MPKTPWGTKRPADVIGNAVHVCKVATGEIVEPRNNKDAAAISLGRRGGLKGGAARAAKLTAKRRSEIARKAAAKRWGK